MKELLDLVLDTRNCAQALRRSVGKSFEQHCLKLAGLTDKQLLLWEKAEKNCYEKEWARVGELLEEFWRQILNTSLLRDADAFVSISWVEMQCYAHLFAAALQAVGEGRDDRVLRTKILNLSTTLIQACDSLRVKILNPPPQPKLIEEQKRLAIDYSPQAKPAAPKKRSLIDENRDRQDRRVELGIRVVHSDDTQA